MKMAPIPTRPSKSPKSACWDKDLNMKPFSPRTASSSNANRSPRSPCDQHTLFGLLTKKNSLHKSQDSRYLCPITSSFRLLGTTRSRRMDAERGQKRADDFHRETNDIRK